MNLYGKRKKHNKEYALQGACNKADKHIFCNNGKWQQKHAHENYQFYSQKNTMPHKMPPYVGYTEFYPTTAYYFKSDFTFKIKSVHDIMRIGLKEMD